MKKVSVIGAGSWGSALAVLLANNGHEVTLWTHDPHEIEMLSTKREQVEKLPGVKLPDNIMIEADLKTALTDEDVVVMAVPSPVVRMVAKQMSPFIKDGQIIVNVAKGIEDVTYKTLSDIIEEEIPNAEVCVLSGPSHAEEVGRGIKEEGKASAARFRAPSPEEVAEYASAYAASKGIDLASTDFDPERFVDFYAQKGWMVGRSRMRDWRATVRNWLRTSKPRNGIAKEVPDDGFSAYD